MKNFDIPQIAWCAGFFDGEGTSSSSYVNNRNYATIVVSVSQKDPLLLYRFQNIIGGYGRVRVSSRNFTLKSGEISVGHVLWIKKFEHAQFVICMLWKYLGPIKKEQWKNALAKHLLARRILKTDNVERRKYKTSAMITKMRLYKSSLDSSNSSHKMINPFLKKESA